MAGIRAVGACIPRLRLSRAKIAAASGWLQPPGRKAPAGERAICNWDEDSLTLAVEAGRSALTDSPPLRGVGRLVLASTTLPFADRSNATLVSQALGLGTSIAALDQTGSLRAGTSALIDALRMAGETASLVVASDRRLAKPGSDQEMTYGAGAAAILVGDDDGLARFVDAEQHAHDFVDHYRLQGQAHDYSLEERWVRESGWLELVPPAVEALLARRHVGPDQIAHCVIAAPTAVARKLLERLQLPANAFVDGLAATCGDTGTAHPLLLLAHTLERAAAGQKLLLIGFGQGVDVLLLEATGAAAGTPVSDALATRRDEDSYVRYLAHHGHVAMDFGMRAERDNRTAQSVAWRKHAALTSFEGGRCSACGTVQFPRSRVCVAPDCRRTDTQQPHRLADTTGRVKTFTEDWLAYTPRPPLVYGNVEFAEGGNAFIEFTDFAPGEAAVGDQVRFVYRLKDEDRVRGFRRYFWKAAPVRGAR